MWKETLDTDMHASSAAPPLPVKNIISGRNSPPERHIAGGFVGVANVGTDGWLGTSALAR